LNYPWFKLLGLKLALGLTVGISDTIALTFVNDVVLGFRLKW
jgi:hypothetical protein